MCCHMPAFACTVERQFLHLLPNARFCLLLLLSTACCGFYGRIPDFACVAQRQFLLELPNVSFWFCSQMHVFACVAQGLCLHLLSNDNLCLCCQVSVFAFAVPLPFSPPPHASSFPSRASWFLVLPLLPLLGPVRGYGGTTAQIENNFSALVVALFDPLLTFAPYPRLLFRVWRGLLQSRYGCVLLWFAAFAMSGVLGQGLPTHPLYHHLV